MSIVNFAISKPLEQKIKQAIKEYGFASKAEFFRFLAINFTNKKQSLPLENDSEILHLTSQIKKLTNKKFSNKTIFSLENQLNNL